MATAPTDSSSGMTVTFRGVRGSMPAAQASHLKYGGNTSCVEVRCGERLLILDAGSGILSLLDQMDVKEVDILLSHTHIDHILGLPFFLPVCKKGETIRIWAGHLAPESGIKNAISQLMSPPLFPLTLADMEATLEWHDFRAGETLTHTEFQKYGIAINTIALNHPDRATAYRISYHGHSICYLTDLEHIEGQVDKGLADFIAGADWLIYDSTYDDKEFERYRGWGHSTWQQAVRLADAGNVRQVALFHHDPAADDTALDQRAAQLQALRPGSLVAREGIEIRLDNNKKI